MARIAGINLPNEKRIEIALTYIYGVGLRRARTILDETGINPDARTHSLSEEQIQTLKDFIEKKFTVEGELRRQTLMNIKRLKDVGSYAGSRHINNLPVHGQRTKTNSRTRRGNVRKTMGSGRRGASEKT